MKTCSVCNKKLGFKTVLKSFWLGYRTISCRGCNTELDHIFKNRLLGGLSVGIGAAFGTMVMLNIETSFGYKIFFGLIINIFTALILSSILIHFFQFKKEEVNNQITSH